MDASERSSISVSDYTNRLAIDTGRRFQRTVRPILRATSKREPVFVGSSVLLRIADSHFLLSAAHVFDVPSERAVPEGVQGGVVVTFGSLGHVELHGTLHATAMPPSGNREDDRVDVAALELSPAEVAAIDDAHFLSLEDLDLRDHSAARRPYVLIGFPGAKQRRQLPDTAFKMEIIPYTSFEADVSDYDNVGLNRDGHLLIKFDKKNSRGTDGKVATPPDPQGESGGGIWRIDDVTSPISESTSIPLVGIFIEHQPRKAKALIATRIQFHLALLKTVRPDLQSYLPDLPSMTETPIYSGQIPPVAT